MNANNAEPDQTPPTAHLIWFSTVFPMSHKKDARLKKGLWTGNPLKGYYRNSEDPDEMPHNAGFYHCLHCLLRQILELP